MCDMDRLGRNEFIGEVRVALKKLKEGENKRYNMGLERTAQVHAHLTVQHFLVDLGIYTLFVFKSSLFVFGLSWVCFKAFLLDARLIPSLSFLILFQNKETNNQTVDQGAVVAEEEVKHLASFLTPLLI